ncbi:MAG: nicotinate-nicotinamide nucleotide adenylyltransferase [Blautia sp.]
MVRLAIADNPHFELSLAETHDQGYTYTKETLRRLTAENPDTDYYFIMGADSLFSLNTGRSRRDLSAGQLWSLLSAITFPMKN